MARYALVKSGIVDTVTEGDGDFPPQPGVSYVACGDRVAPGWIYNGSTFSAPPARAAVIPEGFAEFGVGEFLNAFVLEGVMTAAKRDAILNRLKR
jgi:hypothetical protein